MEVSWPEYLATTGKMVIEELMVGRELAKRLQSVLANSDGSESEKDLVMKIMKSFSDTLFLLNVKEGVAVSEISQIQPGSLDSPCLVIRKSEEYSQESCKSSTTTTTTTATTSRPNKKDRRGCYDRRRTLRTWKRDSPTLINDGQAWRKYGQKVILNVKYPRHYYRCSYKHDQGCKATKQVQRIQVNPPLYRTTYLGHHTCKDLHKHPELILDCNGHEDTSMFISFDNTNLTNKQEQPFLSSFSSIKHEYKEEIMTLDMSPKQDQLSSSSSDNLVPPDLMAAVEWSAGPTTMLSSTLESDHDHGDAIYGMMEYVDFDLDVFQFEC